MDAPNIPQATGGVLSIADLTQDHVNVEIPPYANANNGDQITVSFEGASKIFRYSYVYDGRSVEDVGLSVEFAPLSVFCAGDYEVSYTVVGPGGNPSQSHVTNLKISNPVDIMSTPYYQALLFGTYARGLLDSWIVSAPYTLTQGSAGIILGDPPTPRTILDVHRSSAQGGSATSIGTIQYSGGGWSFELTTDHVDLDKGDELSIMLDSTTHLSIEILI